jgi:hypothetical protein
VPLPEHCFFTPGDVAGLTRELAGFIQTCASTPHADQIEMIRENYNWDAIAVETGRVLAGGKKLMADSS